MINKLKRLKRYLMIKLDVLLNMEIDIKKIKKQIKMFFTNIWNACKNFFLTSYKGDNWYTLIFLRFIRASSVLLVITISIICAFYGPLKEYYFYQQFLKYSRMYIMYTAFYKLFLVYVVVFIGFFLTKLEVKLPIIQNEAPFVGGLDDLIFGKKTAYLNLVVVLKFLSFLITNYRVLLNHLIIYIKRFLLFFYSFTFGKIKRKIAATNLKKNKRKTILWRPIFKKWSYYGLARTYQSKWIWKE